MAAIILTIGYPLIATHVTGNLEIFLDQLKYPPVDSSQMKRKCRTDRYYIVVIRIKYIRSHFQCVILLWLLYILFCHVYNQYNPQPHCGMFKFVLYGRDDIIRKPIGFVVEILFPASDSQWKSVTYYNIVSSREPNGPEYRSVLFPDEYESLLLLLDNP